MNTMTLEQKAARFRTIKRAVQTVNKERAQKRIQQRRDAEHRRDMKQRGIEL